MRRGSKLILAAMMALFASPLFAQISVPEIPFDSTPNLLKMPDNIVLGEAVGVATNSKGHIYVYTRDGALSYTVGTSRQFARGAAAFRALIGPEHEIFPEQLAKGCQTFYRGLFSRAGDGNKAFRAMNDAVDVTKPTFFAISAEGALKMVFRGYLQELCAPGEIERRVDAMPIGSTSSKRSRPVFISRGRSHSIISILPNLRTSSAITRS